MDSGIPYLIEWLLPTGVVTVSVLNRGPGAPDQKERVLKPWIPFGARGWRRCTETAWHPISELPPSWGLRHRGAGDFVAEEEEDEEAEE
jgi:hypothetical protein